MLGSIGSLARSALSLDPSGNVALAATGLETAGLLSSIFSEKPKSAMSLKATIVRELEALRKVAPSLRFLVVVEDLDRLEPREATEVLRIVRQVANFPLTTFLVCFDEKTLSQDVELSLEVESGHAYLEKIFQIYFGLPPQEPFALRRALRKRVSEIDPDTASASLLHEDGYREHLVFDVWAGQLLRSPRDVERVSDAIRLGWPAIAGRADFLDFAWLQLLRVTSPALFRWVREYVSQIGAYRDGGGASQKERTDFAKRLVALLETSGFSDLYVTPGMNYFVPGIADALIRDGERSAFSFNGTELARFEAGRRLGSPSHWRNYFAFEQPSYAVSDKEIASFTQAVLDDQPRAVEQLRVMFDRPHAAEAHFVGQLLERVADLPQSVRTAAFMRGIAWVLAEVMDEFAAKSKPFRSGRFSLWERSLELFRGSRFEGSQELFERGRSINWLAALLRDLGFAFGKVGKDSLDASRQWMTEGDFLSAVTILLDRIAGLSPDELVELPDLLTALYMWLQLGNAELLKTHLHSALLDDDLFLKGLHGMRSWQNSSSTGIGYPLYKTTVARFMDSDAALARLKSLANDGSSEQQIAARALLKDWAEKER